MSFILVTLFRQLDPKSRPLGKYFKSVSWCPYNRSHNLLKSYNIDINANYIHVHVIKTNVVYRP